MAIVFLAKAKEDGTLDWGAPENQTRLRDTIKYYAGRVFRLTLPEQKRTIAQNSYYWMYLGVIEMETGNNANDLHEYFKRKFLRPEFITVTIKGVQQEIKIPASTTKLTKVDMGQYLDRICAETGVPLPNPEDAGYIVG